MKNQKLGALQVILAAVSWSFAGVFCKYIPWDALTIIGFRGLVAAIILGITKRGFIPKITLGNVIGAIGMSATSVLFLCATKLTSSANAIVLQYAMPIFVILLSLIILKQKPTRLEMIATACVLIGVIICSLKGFLNGGGKLTGDLLAIASALTYSLVFFSVKFKNTSAKEYVYLGALFTIPFMLNAPFDVNFVINFKYAACMIVMGICLAMGYYFISKSLSNVEPITSALLSNLEPILNPLWVYIFLGENPGVYSIIGAAIVIVSATAYSILTLKKAEQ